MARFSHDVDILKYEPVLFGELHLPGQVLACGSGAVLSGTRLTAGGVDFLAAGVGPGGVVHLRSTDGSLDGAYEIVAVPSSTQLTVSVVRSTAADPPLAPPAAGDVSYRVSTFDPQAEEAAFQLTEYFGIRPGHPAAAIAAADIPDTAGLRRAAAFLVIANVYAMWASAAGESCWEKSLLYRQFFEKARQRCRWRADPGSGGVADVTRSGGIVRLVRD